MVFARLDHKYVSGGEWIPFAVQFHFGFALEDYKNLAVILVYVAVSSVGANVPMAAEAWFPKTKPALAEILSWKNIFQKMATPNIGQVAQSI